MNKSQNVLITCGYSFGDDHINTEIEHCLENLENKTTVVAFTSGKPGADGEMAADQTLGKWLKHERFGERIFVAGKYGLYNNSLTPIIRPEAKKKLGGPFWV